MIDWDQVARLRDEVGAEDFDDIVALFIEEVEEVTARLANGQSPLSVEEDLHLLKGSALNLGFTRFSDLCQTGETLAAQGGASQVDLHPILSAYAMSKAAFLQALPTAFDSQTSL